MKSGLFFVLASVLGFVLLATLLPASSISVSAQGPKATGTPLPKPTSSNPGRRPTPGARSPRSVSSGATRSNSGFSSNLLDRNDDLSTDLVPTGFQANFFGSTYDSLYVNNNGNVTFDGPQSTYTPYGLTSTNRVIIAPFFADVDTRNTASGVTTYGIDNVNGHTAFGVNWFNVGYYAYNVDKLNTFQLVLIDRSDVSPGDFDIEFNYDQIQWETGDVSGGSGGLGGYSAHVGYSNGTGVAGSYFELAGSGVPGSFLDWNSSSGLIYNSQNSTVLGRYVFQVRNGLPTRHVPVILIPGYFASTCVDPTLYCGWVDSAFSYVGQAQATYQPLLDALQSAGYQRDQDLFVAFYDWAQPNTTSANNRLANIVNQAAANSPTGKVHIITHSNGANVARAYIQQGTSLVDTLILIAPPSQGVVRSYPAWEGADTSQESFGPKIVANLRMIFCRINPWGNAADLLPNIQACIPSLKELLPVGDSYLYQVGSNGTPTLVAPSNMQQQNTFLQTLNSNVQSLYNNLSKVVVIASQGTNDIRTYQQVYARPYLSTDGVLWLDGKPQGYSPITSDGYVKPGAVGDGTILLSRASLPSCQSQANCVWRQNFTADHMGIVSQSINQILQDLGIPVTSAVSRSMPATTTYDELMYAVSGPYVQLLVQDPIGHQIGYQTDGSFVSTIPRATYTRITSDSKLVVVPNPLAGTYIVKSVALGASSDYVGGAFSYATGNTEVQMVGTVNVGTPQQYTHSYQPPTHSIYLPFVRR